ncbi:MAG TPA: aspartate-semialdehyde dehydrogenase [bacterium]|nr:aspartate-semialdehyde dehydrogenase [bacterium]HPN42343.1 aspartate-semialdehyde dehydrogenase [bacterium]
MKKIKCAVLGATGVVGQNFLKLLSGHPYFELTAICASDARTGKKLAEIKEHVKGGIPAEFKEMTFDQNEVKALVDKGVEIAFSGLPTEIATDIEKEAAAKGIKVFSNASSWRMDEHVPILIPEVNYPHLELVKTQQKSSKGFIVTNANCTTTGLTMALLPIIPFGIKKLVVASYQAISGAGYPGVPALDINGNVIPYIKNEEPKMVAETRKICGAFSNNAIHPTDWEVFAHCVRVPTIIGHLISVHAELDKPADYESVLAGIKNYKTPAAVAGLPTTPEKPVIYLADVDRPQPRYDVNLGTPKRTRGMAVAIGRLEVNKNIIRFVTISNNLVRGAAGGSVLNAELAYRQNML